MCLLIWTSWASCSDNKGCAQRFIEFTDENLKPTVKIEDMQVYLYHELIGETSFFNLVLDLQKLRDLFDLNFVINRKVIS